MLSLDFKFHNGVFLPRNLLFIGNCEIYDGVKDKSSNGIFRNFLRFYEDGVDVKSDGNPCHSKDFGFTADYDDPQIKDIFLRENKNGIEYLIGTFNEKKKPFDIVVANDDLEFVVAYLEKDDGKYYVDNLEIQDSFDDFLDFYCSLLDIKGRLPNAKKKVLTDIDRRDAELSAKPFWVGNSFSEYQEVFEMKNYLLKYMTKKVISNREKDEKEFNKKKSNQKS